MSVMASRKRWFTLRRCLRRADPLRCVCAHHNSHPVMTLSISAWPPTTHTHLIGRSFGGHCRHQLQGMCCQLLSVIQATAWQWKAKCPVQHTKTMAGRTGRQVAMHATPEHAGSMAVRAYMEIQQPTPNLNRCSKHRQSGRTHEQQPHGRLWQDAARGILTPVCLLPRCSHKGLAGAQPDGGWQT